MRHILAAAAVGAGIALIAFVVDWLLDHLDETDEPEPLWPLGKPYSRTWNSLGTTEPHIYPSDYVKDLGA